MATPKSLLYQPHELAFRTKYAELKERTRATTSLLPGTPGTLVKRTGTGRAYWYRVYQSASGSHAMPAHDAPGGHTMRGLVIGMHITPALGYKEPVVANRRTLNLLIQKKPNGLIGGQTAYGFVLQTGAAYGPASPSDSTDHLWLTRQA